MPATASAAPDAAEGTAPPGRPRPKRGRDESDALGLVWTLVRTDFKVRYHGTVGGFVWALLKPLTMFAVLMAVFSLIFQTDPNYRLNLIIGLCLWDFFSDGTKVGLSSLAAKSFLLTKTRFPKWILVVTSVSNPLITLSVLMVAIVTTSAAGGRLAGPWAAALVVVYMLQLCLIVIGFSLATSALLLRYRDLNQVWELLLQAGFFVAPVVYPLSILPERLHFYLYLWPPTAVIQFARSVLVLGTVPSLRAHAMLAAASLLALGTGALVFKRLSPRCVEYL
jgi:homopolymeric O-antigen transport system permease protein